MRLLLTKNSRKKLFIFLKEKYEARSFIDLAQKMGFAFKTMKKWMYAELYMPDKIIPKDFDSLEIIDKQKDNWGMTKAGKLGGKRSVEIMKAKLGEKAYSEFMSKKGKKVINILWKRYGKEKLTKMAVEGKIKKRENESRMLEKENENYFINEEISLDCKEITYTSSDIKKRLILPNKMTPELAEEIGVHLGDGCLSKNRNYFSVKTNKKEEGYMQYLFRLYKKLYNLDLNLMMLPSVVGFEVYSKALCEFKNKVLGLPYGEKIYKIEVPKKILDTKNKRIYCALIKGLFDTDGCACTVKKNNKNYPIISITIKSEKLIGQVSEMLKKLGYIPSYNKQSIALNGSVMLKKWVKEINSNNPKNIESLQRANS